jgi:alpha-mannosidase
MGSVGDIPTDMLGQSLIRVSPGAVVVEGLKMAEDNDTIIARLYESHGGECTASIAINGTLAEAWLCTLLEEDIMRLPIDDDRVELPFRPFEIKTIRLIRQNPTQGART